MKADELAVRVEMQVDQMRRNIAKLASSLFNLTTSTPEDADCPIGPKFSEVVFGGILETGEKCWQEKYLLEAHVILKNPLIPDKKARLVSLAHTWHRTAVVLGQQRKVTGVRPMISVMEAEVRLTALLSVTDYLESILERLDDDE